MPVRSSQGLLPCERRLKLNRQAKSFGCRLARLYSESERVPQWQRMKELRMSSARHVRVGVEESSAKDDENKKGEQLAPVSSR